MKTSSILVGLSLVIISLHGVFLNAVSTNIYKTDLADSQSSYSSQIASLSKGTCAQKCLEMDCFRFSYDSQTNKCLVDTCIGGGQFNRSSNSQEYRSLMHPTDNLLARAKNVTHSTATVGSYDYSGRLVVDGIYIPMDIGLTVYDSVMVLDPEQDPWFEIDLEHDFCLEGMKFWQRLGTYGENLQDLALTVATEAEPWIYIPCAYRSGLLEFVEKVDCSSPINGRYIKVVQQTVGESLALHEVEVYGH